MIVVSDTTPLIALLKARRLELVKQLFNEVLIPSAVFEELTRNARYEEEARTIEESDYIGVVDVLDTEYVQTIQELTGLDRGESEAIACAKERHADFLLMDEENGRRVARNAKIRIMGSAGILANACISGYITKDDVDDAIERMREENIYFSDDVIADVYRLIETRGSK